MCNMSGQCAWPGVQLNYILHSSSSHNMMGDQFSTAPLYPNTTPWRYTNVVLLLLLLLLLLSSVEQLRLTKYFVVFLRFDM